MTIGWFATKSRNLFYSTITLTNQYSLSRASHTTTITCFCLASVKLQKEMESYRQPLALGWRTGAFGFPNLCLSSVETKQLELYLDAQMLTLAIYLLLLGAQMIVVTMLALAIHHQ